MAIKKFSTGNILSLHSKTFSQKKILLESEGQTFEVLIDTKFQPSKIQALIMEMAEQYGKISHLDDVLDVTLLANFMIIKHFTNLNIAKNVEEDVKKQIGILKALLDLELLEPILNSFDQKELDKINKYIKKASDNIKEMDKSPEAKKDFEDIINSLASLENPEVFLGDREEIEAVEVAEE